MSSSRIFTSCHLIRREVGFQPLQIYQQPESNESELSGSFRRLELKMSLKPKSAQHSHVRERYLRPGCYYWFSSQHIKWFYQWLWLWLCQRQACGVFLYVYTDIIFHQTNFVDIVIWMFWCEGRASVICISYVRVRALMLYLYDCFDPSAVYIIAEQDPALFCLGRIRIFSRCSIESHRGSAQF